MNETSSEQNPQNPYCSFLVSASAGCGKTFQLSRRFLALVAAGASPESILTVTFTVKAAAEMRERILHDAALLISSPEEAHQFNALMQSFHRDAQQTLSLPSGRRWPPPYSALEVAEKVLSATQIMNITTIDSVFFDWLKKFGYEAGRPLEDEKDLAPKGSGRQTFERTESVVANAERILDATESREISKRAWNALVASMLKASGDDWNGFDSLLARLPGGRFLDAIKRTESLDRLQTFIWYCQRTTGSAFIAHESTDDEPLSDFKEWTECYAADLRAIASQIANGEKQSLCLEAISKHDFAGLIEASLITKDNRVNGLTIKGKKREALAAEVAAVEESLARLANKLKRLHLNQEGEALASLYLRFHEFREKEKIKLKALEFSDLAKGAYRLFVSDEAAPARYLIHKRLSHLMVDEFQDTSRLQWAVFRRIALELLSGQGVDSGSLPGTVFLVGDEKQSIYGFREADPSVMHEAAEELEAFGLRTLPLNQSYRSAQIVLDLVNQVFCHDLLPGYAQHRTAQDLTSQTVVPNFGRVVVAGPLGLDTPLDRSDPSPEEDVSEVSSVDDGPISSAEEAEAELVATYLAQALADPSSHPVYDKSLKAMRPLEPRDCAILYRAATRSHLFERMLRKQRVPCQREEARGYFARSEIQDMMALMKFLATPADLASLIGVLRSPLGRVNDSLVMNALAAAKPYAHLPEHTRRFLDELNVRAPDAVAMIRGLLSQRDRLAPHELVTLILTDHQGLSAYLRSYPPTDAALAEQNLLRFIELCVEVERNGSQTLPRFFKNLENLKALDEIGLTPSATNAVTLMTIHKAKGLEFPLVALVDTGRPWKGRDRYFLKGLDQNDQPGIYYVGVKNDQPRGDAQFARIEEALREEQLAESHRLVYVALTRAKHYLLVSGHAQKQKEYEASYLSQMVAALSSPAPEGLGVEVRSLQLEDGRCHSLTSWTSLPKEGPVVQHSSAPPTVARPSVLHASAPETSSIVPAEIVSVAPSHKLHLREQERPIEFFPAARLVQKSTSWAKLQGLFVHAGLEFFVKGKDFDAQAVWAQLLAAETTRSERRDHAGAGAAEQLAVAALAKVLASTAWRQLTASSHRCLAEVPVIQLLGSHLKTGKIDLLVETANSEIIVVDYKTTTFEDGTIQSLDTLRQVAASLGHQRQVQDYLGAVQALYPGKIVRGAVFYTSLPELVMLDVVADPRSVEFETQAGQASLSQGLTLDL